MHLPVAQHILFQEKPSGHCSQAALLSSLFQALAVNAQRLADHCEGGFDNQPQLSVRQLALERSRLGLTLVVSTMPLPLITLLTCLSQLSFAYCTRSRDLWLIYLHVSQLLLQSNSLHPNMVSYFYCPNLGPCIGNSTCFCVFIAVCLWLRYITITKQRFYKMVGRASYLAE